MRALYLFSVWLHILAAITWVGGTIFLVLVLVPATRQSQFRRLAPQLIQWTGARFKRVSWIALTILILTGIFNLGYRGFGWADVWNGQLWRGTFGQTLGIKLILVAITLFTSALHDFVIGPRARAAWQANPGSPAALRQRRRASWIGRINLILALIIVALGTLLVRGGL